MRDNIPFNSQKTNFVLALAIRSRQGDRCSSVRDPKGTDSCYCCFHRRRLNLISLGLTQLVTNTLSIVNLVTVASIEGNSIN
jgi:hypothetical protein